MISEHKTSVLGFFLGMLLAGALSGILLLGRESAKLSAATAKLRQYTQECDDTAFLATLHSCFSDMNKSCGMSGPSCSSEAMDQCNVIATNAHCTGRKE